MQNFFTLPAQIALGIAAADIFRRILAAIGLG